MHVTNTQGPTCVRQGEDKRLLILDMDDQITTYVFAFKGALAT